MRIQAGMIGKCPVYTVVVEAGHLPSDFPQVKRLMLELSDTSRPAVLDISAVEFVDSTGIGALIGLARAFDERGGCVVLCGIRPRMAEIFEAVRLDKMMPFRDSAIVAATELDKTKKPLMANLISKNPTTADVRAKWEDRMRLGAKREAVSAASAETQESTYLRDNPQDAAPKSTMVAKLVESASVPSESAPPSASPAPAPPKFGSDWEELLTLYARTDELAKRNGVQFGMETTFGKLMADIGVALAGRMTRPPG